MRTEFHRVLPSSETTYRKNWTLSDGSSTRSKILFRFVIEELIPRHWRSKIHSEGAPVSPFGHILKYPSVSREKNKFLLLLPLLSERTGKINCVFDGTIVDSNYMALLEYTLECSICHLKNFLMFTGILINFIKISRQVCSNLYILPTVASGNTR